ncbi:Chalcone and stilbene synthases-like [[Actinomadura] parvosata subsp. kistnae]|nr:Chalcone and stilbene synthases-like [Actinomadura parvosata subsp. kistnae]
MTAVAERPAPAVSTGITAIAGVGTATSGTSYTQAELLDLLGVEDPKMRSLFLNSAIERRHLTLPPPAAAGAGPRNRRATCWKSTSGSPSKWAARHWRPA